MSSATSVIDLISQYVSMTFTVIIVQGAGVGIAVEQIDTVSFDAAF